MSETPYFLFDYVCIGHGQMIEDAGVFPQTIKCVAGSEALLLLRRKLKS